VLQLLVAQQQALNALGDLVKVLGVGHILGLKFSHCRVATRSNALECAVLVLAVWFTRCSSTGSRRESSHKPT
jgi:hypothetical protein